jgi:hypothetical protein
VEYEIIDKKMLHEDDAKEYNTLPDLPEYYFKREGDVALYVREVTTGHGRLLL